MPQEQAKQANYKSTLNLPKTSLPMKANLVQNEPTTLKQWQNQNLYAKIRQARAGSPKYIFHDGPPYANGSIHLGHLLNKALKDFVVRSKTMAGYDCPYVPGWDCHGLPIEHKVMQDLDDKAADMVPIQIRKRCRNYAEKFVKLQSKQMQRLLTLADYDKPYLTMHPAYEAATLNVFAELVAKGLVYRMKKSVHWSIEHRTALAEAELEYYDRQDTSIYAMFEIESPAILPETLNAPANEPVHLMIWTTTPWTLPSNMAVAVDQTATYALYRFEHNGDTHHAILAEQLAREVLTQGGAVHFEQVGVCAGNDLKKANTQYHHPLQPWRCPVLTADFVTMDNGTGLVHNAPGHGVEDFEMGRTNRLYFHHADDGPTRVCWVAPEQHEQSPPPDPDIYCPVQEDGTYDESVPQSLRGVLVWDANQIVVDHLRANSRLFHDHQFTHSYPHDWRSKKPIIFRATEQWFLVVTSESHKKVQLGDASLREALDKHPEEQPPKPAKIMERSLQALALESIQHVQFIPAWGRNRMRGMLESRPDWCLSRQRAWGLPIPAFFNDRGDYLLTAASVRAVADKLAEHGSDYWFKVEARELLEGYDPNHDHDAPDWASEALRSGQLHKATDIFDVWFESGSSWNAVMLHRFGDDGFPADLYLEGSDQHRGWFQLSMLPALGIKGQPPFKTVLTHGFMVDKDGHALSKSKGHTIEGLLDNYGVDVLRWWVSTLNVDNDIKVDDQFFDLAGEQFRKVRNTLRYLLSNLADYDNAADRHTFTNDDATSMDAWALDELGKLVMAVCDSYEQLNFRRASEAIFHFCNDTMSAIYLMAAKDRLYCDKPGSPRRRRCQTALRDIADTLIRLLATIMPHTADEAWHALHGPNTDSVHLQLLPQQPAAKADRRWATIMVARSQWLKAIEDARQRMAFDNPLDCGLLVPADAGLAGFDLVDLADLCGISRFEFSDDTKVAQVTDLRDEARCQRSWKRDGTVKPRSDGGLLSDRDADATGL